MSSPEGDGDAKAAARSAVLLGVSVLALASPLRLLWAREGAPWYTPFALWLGLVAIAAIAVRRPSIPPAPRRTIPPPSDP